MILFYPSCVIAVAVVTLVNRAAASLSLSLTCSHSSERHSSPLTLFCKLLWSSLHTLLNTICLILSSSPFAASSSSYSRAHRVDRVNILFTCKCDSFDAQMSSTSPRWLKRHTLPLVSCRCIERHVYSDELSLFVPWMMYTHWRWSTCAAVSTLHSINVSW